MLTSAWTQPLGALADPWFSGVSAAYYAFGYLTIATVARLAGTEPAVAYNLALATWQALLIVAAAGLLLSLVRAPWRRPRETFAAASLAAAGVALAGSPAALRDTLAHWAAGAETSSTWWWFASTRVLRDLDPRGRPHELISETPAFGQVLGDLHPHLLGQPMLLLAAACAVNLLIAVRLRRRDRSGRRIGMLPGSDWSLAAALGVAAVVVLVNPWDGVAAFALVAGAWVLARPGGPRRWLEGFAVGVALLAVTAILGFPFLATAQSQAQGIRPNLLHPTPAAGLVATQGFWLLGVALWLAPAVHRRRLPAALARFLLLAAAGASALLAGALWATLSPQGRTWWLGVAAETPTSFAWERWRSQPSSLVLLFLLVALLLSVHVRGGRRRTRAQGVFLLAGVGLLLLVLPELVCVQDFFDSRMNTLFKLHGQAWLLLAVVTSAASLEAWRAGRRWRGGAIALTALIAAATAYSAAAWSTRLAEHAADPPTLDGLAHLAPEERELFSWVRENLPPRAVVVQAGAIAYAPAAARLSGATGRPTLLGWSGHEKQWRGHAFGRLARGRTEALATIYRRGAPAQVADALARWHVDYVLVGPVERLRYGIGARREADLRSVLRLELESGPYRLYRRRATQPAELR